MLGAAKYISYFNARENLKIINGACLVLLSFSSGSYCVVKFS